MAELDVDRFLADPTRLPCNVLNFLLLKRIMVTLNGRTKNNQK